MVDVLDAGVVLDGHVVGRWAWCYVCEGGDPMLAEVLFRGMSFEDGAFFVSMESCLDAVSGEVA